MSNKRNELFIKRKVIQLLLLILLEFLLQVVWKFQ